MHDTQRIDHLTWSLEALYIGIVKVMLTGPASFIIFAVYIDIRNKNQTKFIYLPELIKSITITKWKSYHVTLVKMWALHGVCVQTHQQSGTNYSNYKYEIITKKRKLSSNQTEFELHEWSMFYILRKKKEKSSKSIIKILTFFNPHSSLLFASLKSVVFPTAPGSNSKLTL